MLQWFTENWITIVGGSGLSGIIGWFLGGKQQKNQELKKGDVEINTAEVDYAAKVRELYESLNAKLVQENETLKLDRDAIINEFKEEKKYFREKIDVLRNDLSNLQTQFNNIQSAYNKELEQSQNWEKIHKALLDKYQTLENNHEELKKLYDKLKSDFEKHKKQAKQNEN